MGINNSGSHSLIIQAERCNVPCTRRHHSVSAPFVYSEQHMLMLITNKETSAVLSHSTCKWWIGAHQGTESPSSFCWVVKAGIFKIRSLWSSRISIQLKRIPFLPPPQTMLVYFLGFLMWNSLVLITLEILIFWNRELYHPVAEVHSCITYRSCIECISIEVLTYRMYRVSGKQY